MGNRENVWMAHKGITKEPEGWIWQEAKGIKGKLMM
jgi:hypothetical protein